MTNTSKELVELAKEIMNDHMMWIEAKILAEAIIDTLDGCEMVRKDSTND